MAEVSFVNLLDLIFGDVVRLYDDGLAKTIEAVNEVAGLIKKVVMREVLLRSDRAHLDDDRFTDDLLRLVVEDQLMVRHTLTVQDVDKDAEGVLQEAGVDHWVGEPVDWTSTLINIQR